MGATKRKSTTYMLTDADIQTINPADPEQMERLWADRKRLGNWVVRQMMAHYGAVNGEVAGYTYDDLMQEAYMALYTALKRWRPNAGAFNTAYVFTLRGRIAEITGHNRLQRRDALTNAISLDAPASPDYPSCTLLDLLPDPDADTEGDVINAITRERTTEIVHRAMGFVGERDRTLLEGWYFHDIPMDTLSEQTGIPRDEMGYHMRGARRRYLTQYIQTGGVRP